MTFYNKLIQMQTKESKSKFDFHKIKRVPNVGATFSHIMTSLTINLYPRLTSLVEHSKMSWKVKAQPKIKI